jgi:NYN domain
MKTCAIFIDLENFYRSLKKYDRDLAMEIVRNPEVWMSSLRHYDQSGGELQVRRDFVVAKAYFGSGFMNDFERDAKQPFAQGSFRKAGIDPEFCRVLSGYGKNAADIRMVVDCISFVNKYTRLDEVFILADDADFLPLVQELRRFCCGVYITSITANTSSAEYRKTAERMGAQVLTGEDIKRLLPQHDGASEMVGPAVSKDELTKIKSILQEKANVRQGFLPLADASNLLKNAFPREKTRDWWKMDSASDFFFGLSQKAGDWMRFDVAQQGLRIPNMKLDLKDWGASAELTGFVRNTLVAIDDPIPFFAPAKNTQIFDTIAYSFNKGGDTKGKIDRAMSKAKSADHTINFAEARAMVTAVEQFFGEWEGQIAPSECARAWRANIFMLARQPDFMKTVQGRKSLVEWFLASDETFESAIDETVQDFELLSSGDQATAPSVSA